MIAAHEEREGLRETGAAAERKKSSYCEFSNPGPLSYTLRAAPGQSPTEQAPCALLAVATMPIAKPTAPACSVVKAAHHRRNLPEPELCFSWLPTLGGS